MTFQPNIFYTSKEGVLQLICLKTAYLKHRDQQVPFNWQDGGEETSEGESDDGAEKEREDGKAGDHWVSF